MEETEARERGNIPHPTPVTIGGVRYQAIAWGKARGLGQNGGYLAAVDEATGRELWLLKVYDVTYDGEREDDVQDVFIKEIAREGAGLLRVTNERGGSFRVDVERRAVV